MEILHNPSTLESFVEEMSHAPEVFANKRRKIIRRHGMVSAMAFGFMFHADGVRPEMVGGAATGRRVAKPKEKVDFHEGDMISTDFYDDKILGMANAPKFKFTP